MMAHRHPPVGRAWSGEVCPQCGADGAVMHDRLTDKLFGTPGEFQLDRCSSRRCGLAWLHAMPAEEDVGAFYDSYYTHEEPAPVRVAGELSAVRRWFAAVWPLGIHRRRRDWLRGLCLPDAGGVVLEVGTGSGRNLNALRERGWRVVGQDIDPVSAGAAAARFGIEVHAGPIAELPAELGHFDAVLLHHVVEHLREPERDLRRCRDLLADGGRLVVMTPNIDSVGHRLLRRRWRGLEPPRHLFLYNPSTMRELLRRAGFTDVDVIATAARTEMITYDAFDAMCERWPAKLRYAVAKGMGVAAQLIAWLLRADWRGSGDEVVAIAVK